MRKLKPEKLQHLIDSNALLRPGPMGVQAHRKYAKIKSGKEMPEYYRGTEEITRSTGGLIIYQEQVMKIVQAVAGFTPQEADDVRKAMGKKIQSLLDKYKAQFIEGATERQYPLDEAEELWDVMETFAGYGFNLSHAAAYATIGYLGMYFKVYFPIIFWVTSFKYCKDEDELSHLVSEFSKSSSGVLMLPDINVSEDRFSMDYSKSIIYWSFQKIKQLGQAAAAEIIRSRDAVGGKFFSMSEFCAGTNVNIRVKMHLVFSGCFDLMYGLQPGESYRRMEIMRDMYEHSGKKMDPLPKELDSEYSGQSWWWDLKQIQICGMGRVDFKDLSQNIWGADHYLVDFADCLKKDAIDTRVCTAGVVKNVIIRNSKRGDFAIIELEHNDHIMELIAWNDKYEDWKDVIDNWKDKIFVFTADIKGPNKYRPMNAFELAEDANYQWSIFSL